MFSHFANGKFGLSVVVVVIVVVVYAGCRPLSVLVRSSCANEIIGSRFVCSQM